MASLMILAWGASVLAAEGPIDSTISYQGRLTNGGDPAEGEHDMRFSLYDAVSGGNQEGPTLVFDGDQPNPDPVDVVGGLFQVGLTFGNGVFLGDALWLEIEVRPHADGSYVPLDPRQPLTAVPYALYALDGPGGGGGFWGANGTHIYKNNSGNVGIGTTNPQTMLDVFGEDAVLRVESISNDFGPKLVFRNRNAGSGVYQGTIQFQDANNTLAEVGYRRPRIGVPRLVLKTAGGGMSIFDGGEVGIGDVSTPDGKLHVLNQGLGKGGLFETSNASNATNTVDVRTNGNVNSQALHAQHSGLGDCGYFVIDNADSQGEAVEARTNGTGDAVQAWNTGTGRAGYFRIDNADSDAAALVCTTFGTGLSLHVARGTDASPEGGGFAVIGFTNGRNLVFDDNEIMARVNGQTSTLYLNNDGGAVRVPLLEITGADLAEKFPVSDNPQPGMVVEIDPDRTGTLRIARGGAYNSRVAGVVSGANDLSVGAVLGHLPGLENAPPIALSGRVWVQCDASTGTIKPGDLLTTSDTPGHAMKATDRARAYGATIGKAMSSLKEGQGMVLVLVSLQ